MLPWQQATGNPATLSMHPRIQIRLQILFRDDLQWKEKILLRFLFKEKVIRQLADADKGLTPGILIDEKIDDSRVEIMHVLFEKVVGYQSDTVLAMFL